MKNYMKEAGRFSGKNDGERNEYSRCEKIGEES